MASVLSVPVQAEGHLPPQMDPRALQDARLALGGPNSEMVLSLLRTVAQQAADTGGARPLPAGRHQQCSGACPAARLQGRIA